MVSLRLTRDGPVGYICFHWAVVSTGPIRISYGRIASTRKVGDLQRFLPAKNESTTSTGAAR